MDVFNVISLLLNNRDVLDNFANIDPENVFVKKMATLGMRKGDIDTLSDLRKNTNLMLNSRSIEKQNVDIIEYLVSDGVMRLYYIFLVPICYVSRQKSLKRGFEKLSEAETVFLNVSLASPENEIVKGVNAFNTFMQYFNIDKIKTGQDFNKKYITFFTIGSGGFMAFWSSYY